MRHRLVALSFLLALLPGAARAQSFTDSISVVEVEIPVQVLWDGAPVDGLERADFEVRVDGEPVELVGFDVLRYDGRPAPVDERVAEPASPAVARPRHVLVLFDLVFSERHRLAHALDGVRTMVDEQLAPGDRVAVAFLSGSGARLLVGFTRDREEVHLGLDLVQGLLDLKGPRIQQAATQLQEHLRTQREEAPVAFLSQRFGAAAALGLGPELGGLALDPTGIVLVRVGDGDGSTSIDPVVASLVPASPEEIGASLAQGAYGSAIRSMALEIGRLATLLRDVPGPKDVLLLSEGFASGVLESHASQERAQALGVLHDMLEALIRGGWTLHGIDVEGIPTWDAKGFDAHALFFLANETGGQLLENYNHIDDATDRYLQRTRVTYLLTVRAEQVPVDGARHKIDVRLRNDARPGRVHHRPAFFAPRPAAALTDLERELDLVQRLLGTEELNQLAARTHAGRIDGGPGSGGLRFAIALPPASLAEDVGAGIVPLDVRIFVLDERGGALAAWTRRVTLDLGKVGDRIAGGGLHLVGSIETPANAHRLRLLVRIPGRAEVALLTVAVEDRWAPPDWAWKEGLTLRAG